jgi:hypothetical protein
MAYGEVNFLCNQIWWLVDYMMLDVFKPAELLVM